MKFLSDALTRIFGGLLNEEAPWRAFSKRSDGNVAIWFAMLLLPMLGFSFGALKFAEMSSFRSDMNDALEASALAVARRAAALGVDPCTLSENSDGTIQNQDAFDTLTTYGQEFFLRNFARADNIFGDKTLTQNFNPENHVTFSVGCSTVRATSSAYLDMGSILSEFFEVSAIPVGRTTEVSLPGAGRVELALVLDVTGSMDWCPTPSGGNCGSNNRMKALKDAAGDMLDSLYGPGDDIVNNFVRVAIVPFNTGVNVGPESFFYGSGGGVTSDGLSWIDTEAEAFWHGANFFHVEYDDSSGASNSGNWFDIDPDRKVNHFDLFNSIDEDYAEWKGCVEARPFPLDEVDAEPGTAFTETDYNAARTKPSDLTIPDDVTSSVISRINMAWNDIPTIPSHYTLAELADPANTKFVPWFVPDEPDCYYGACGGYESQSGWQRDFFSGNWWDAEDFPANILDGPDSDFGDYEDWYQNRYFVLDYKYTNVRNGTRDSSEPYRNLLMHYRNVYHENIVVAGDIVSGGKADCGQGIFSFGYDSSNAADMVEIINRFGAYECREGEYFLRQAYPGIWNETTQTYDGKYDDVYAYSSTSDETSTREIASQGPNYNCSTPILRLTNRKKDITDHLDKLIPGGGTNVSVGAAWGWRVLSNRAPFVDGTDPNTLEGKRWRKFMVLMTDGENSLTPLSNHNDSYFGAYGFLSEDRLGINSDSGRSTRADEYEAEFDNKMIRICHRARMDGIKVFSIGFAIQAGGAIEQALKACAIETDAYFRADNASELNEAFGNITDQIVELHISG